MLQSQVYEEVPDLENHGIWIEFEDWKRSAVFPRRQGQCSSSAGRDRFGLVTSGLQFGHNLI